MSWRMYLMSVPLIYPPMIALMACSESESASVPARLSVTFSVPEPAKGTSCSEPSRSSE